MTQMDIKEHFIDLFQYDAWASGRAVKALQALLPDDEPAAGGSAAPEVERALDLLSHLLRAQAVWLGRILRTEAMHLPIWERDPPGTCAGRLAENTRAWLHFLQGCTPEDFGRRIAYTNTKGEPFSSTLREIAAHVVNHGSYHRAQIALLLRTAGAEPPATDYIVYARSARQEA